MPTGRDANGWKHKPAPDVVYTAKEKEKHDVWFKKRWKEVDKMHTDRHKEPNAENRIFN